MRSHNNFSFKISVIFLGLICMTGISLSYEKPENKPVNTIAVLDIETSNNFKQEQAEVVAEAIRDEIAKTNKYEVLSREKMNRLLDGEKCPIQSYSKECFIKLGRILNTDKIITGSAAFYNNSYYLSFLIANTKTGEMENIVEDESIGNKNIIALSKKIANGLINNIFYFLQPNQKLDWKSNKDVNEYFLEVLEAPDKKEWQKPEMVIANLPIKAGDTIADLGAGSGYFTMLLSKKTGEKGIVYAVDIETDMLEYIKNRAYKEGLNNITTVLAQYDNPSLSNNSLDLIFMCEAYYFLVNRQNYLNILNNILRKEGKLVIIDHHVPDFPLTPPLFINFNALGNYDKTIPQYILDSRLISVSHFKNQASAVGPPFRYRTPREKAIEEILKAGFKIDKEYDFLPYQYFLVFSKAE